MCDFGPPGEIVADNGASFRSNEFLKLLEDWNINIHFRCAYRPQGNGIEERNHCTVKCMASRTNKAINECVFSTMRIQRVLVVLVLLIVFLTPFPFPF